MTANKDANLHDLSESLAAPFATVTTDQCVDARTALERYAGDNAELTVWAAMLGIDDEGLADGVARGIWTEVG